MSKAYSNKALPSGTILREWRLENVLGVGGFGIVYKGRGIYFDELVAIKEYFPSSISERDEDDTVVPIDSDAEEVHALGLKKFVEEAKLLWNLSTPTRHPNIVSVRSLFEIHGTAYMVMDFEDGVSLSALLKKGTRWNEASLTAMFRPVAEGLERAHRVGVLHRDIKPPNILINEDGRPVLIDFGSARFESGDATSTKVTFHTPPYAAIEQYVRTFDQGPWTDVYALGVVLYECITGTKPAEVLERMHGEAGAPLKDGDWPGYSGKFLNAVNAAMGIKPSDRPQSISEWLELFDAPDAALPVADEGDDDDATRVVAFAANPEIQPVAPPPPGFTRGERVDVPVPDDTNEVRFKRAGEDTHAGRKRQALDDLVPPPAAGAEPEAEAAPVPEPAPSKKKQPSAKEAAPAPPRVGTAKKKLSPVLLGGIAAAVIAVGAGGWYFVQQQGGAEPDPTLAEIEAEFVPVDIEEAGGVAPAVEALVAEARQAGAPAAALAKLTEAVPRLAGQAEAQQNAIAIKAAADFAATLLADADGRAARMARTLPWANPSRPNAASGENAARQKVARDIRFALSGVRSASVAAAAAKDPAAALTAARQGLTRNGALNAAIAIAYRTGGAKPPADIRVDSSAAIAPTTVTAPAQPQPRIAEAPQPAAASGPVGKPSRLFPAKFRRFNSIVDSARDTADDVIKLARGSAPGGSASDAEKEGYRVRQANAQTARGYLTYLDGLENSMRGDRSEADVDLNTANAERTQGYLRDILARSRATRN